MKNLVYMVAYFIVVMGASMARGHRVWVRGGLSELCPAVPAAVGARRLIVGELVEVRGLHPPGDRTAVVL